MRTELLKVLLAAAESKNFRVAAERLGLSQASVTNKLAELSGSFSTPLFVTEGRKKILTPFGLALVAATKTQLAALELAVTEVERAFDDVRSKPLRVGCRPEVFSFLAPNLPQAYIYHLESLSGPQVGPAALAGQIDFGFTHALTDSNHLLARKAFRSHAKLVVHRSLLGRGLARENLWKNEKFLTETPSVSYGKDGHLLDRVCKVNGLEVSDLDIRFVAESWSVLAALVEKAIGYAIVPNYIQLNAETIEIPIPSSVGAPFDFYFVTRTAYREVSLYRELLKVRWS